MTAGTKVATTATKVISATGKIAKTTFRSAAKGMGQTLARFRGLGGVKGIVREFGEDVKRLLKGSRSSFCTKVVLGSEDLSQFAINFRKTLPIPNHKGNIAVFEYIDNAGVLVKEPFSTLKGIASHSEELAIDFFARLKIPKANIKRIYSELEPCELPGHTCKAKLAESFPNAKKSFSYDYPGGLDNTIRQASVNQRFLDLVPLLK